jgi:murein DD-endopeptidase MepM/ murein hydrolase activator NlpD
MLRSLIVLLLGLAFSDLAAVERSIELSSLEGEQAKELKAEIARNLKSGMQYHRLEVPLRFVAYRLKKREHFYTVVTRLSQDPDTLASLNSLAHPDELKEGDVILVPNARGVFRDPGKEKGGMYVSVMKGSGTMSFDFFPGRRFEPRERDFFQGIVFLHPLPTARQSSGFGWRKDPIHGRPAFHGGIDLAAPEGTPARAAESGEVIFIGNRAGYGRTVMIQHDYGYVTLYGHLSRILVKKGEKVQRGMDIGLVGKTGRVTGPHLHFEILKEGRQRRPVFDVRHR